MRRFTIAWLNDRYQDKYMILFKIVDHMIFDCAIFDLRLWLIWYI